MEINTQTRQVETFEKRCKEHLFPLRSNNNNSKFAQHLLENGVHSFGKINDILETLHVSRKGTSVDTIKNFYIYNETIKGKKLMVNTQSPKIKFWKLY